MDIATTVALIVIGVYTVLGLIRIHQIFRYRMNLLDAIHVKNLGEISKKVSPVKGAQRYETFASVTHEEMVFKFWRKPSSFYDPAFLKEIGQ